MWLRRKWLLLACIVLFLVSLNPAFAWWNTTWTKSYPIYISSSGDGVHVQEPVMINVSNLSCKDTIDKTDLRVLYQNTTLIQYEWEILGDSIWVHLNSSSTINNDYWLYCYGDTNEEANTTLYKIQDSWEDGDYVTGQRGDLWTNDTGLTGDVIVKKQNALEGDYSLYQYGRTNPPSKLISNDEAIDTGILIFAAKIARIKTDYENRIFIRDPNTGNTRVGLKFLNDRSIDYLDSTSNWVGTGLTWTADHYETYKIEFTNEDTNAYMNITKNGTESILNLQIPNPNELGNIQFWSYNPDTIQEIDMVFLTNNSSTGYYNISLYPVLASYELGTPFTLPAITVNTANNTSTSDTTPAISVTVTDNEDDSTKVTLFFNETNVSYNPAVQNDTATDLSPSSEQSEGIHWFYLSADDNTRNNVTDGNWTIIIDTTNPSVTLTGLSTSNGSYAQDWIYINASFNDTMFPNEAVLDWNGTNESMTTFMQIDAQHLYYSVNKTSLNDGIYYWKVYVNDSAGNEDRTVNRTAALDTIPPTNITNLNDTETGTSWILWNWTNPGTDFDHAEIYRDGTFKTNTSNDFYKETGLRSSTNYELEVRPIDSVGNIGNWTNDTGKTKPGGDDNGGGGGGGGGGSAVLCPPNTTLVGGHCKPINQTEPEEEVGGAPVAIKTPTAAVETTPEETPEETEEIVGEKGLSALLILSRSLKNPAVLLVIGVIAIVSLLVYKGKIELPKFSLSKIKLLSRIKLGERAKTKPAQEQAPGFKPAFPAYQYAGQNSQPLEVTSRMQAMLDALNPRERQIMETIAFHGGASTQARVYHATGMPTTTLARWVDSLERRGLVQTSKRGKLRRIELTEKFLGAEE